MVSFFRNTTYNESIERACISALPRAEEDGRRRCGHRASPVAPTRQTAPRPDGAGHAETGPRSPFPAPRHAADRQTRHTGDVAVRQTSRPRSRARARRRRTPVPDDKPNTSATEPVFLAFSDRVHILPSPSSFPVFEKRRKDWKMSTRRDGEGSGSGVQTARRGGASPLVARTRQARARAWVGDERGG